MIDPKLKEWATERQAEYIDAVNEHGGYRAAARELGVNYTTIYTAIDGAKKKAALQGYAPDHDMTKTAAEGYQVKGVSTLYDQDGQVKAQWVKTQVDSEQQEEIRKAVVDELKKELKPVDPVSLNHRWDQPEEQLNLYTLTDIHIGMMAWHEEGGADWDLKIAEKAILQAFAYLIENSKPAKYGFFNQLGDALHSDGMLPVTPTHGHVLDQDGRFHKIVRTTIRIFRQVIMMLLQKHEEVIVLMAQGNHDLASSVWLQELFAVLHENDPRVDVIVSPLPFYAHRHGRCLLAFHHGHKAKLERLPDIMTSEFRELYGRTDKTYIHTGHLHHSHIKEFGSAIVEQHPTIAARDAHASHGGYEAERMMNCITYHKTRRVVGRVSYLLHPEDMK